MPSVTSNKITAPPPQERPAIPVIQEPEARSSVVDTRYTPLSSLVTFVSGRSFTVDYYSQVMGKDDEIVGLDPSQSALYQSYRKIHKLEMKITSNGMSHSQDETNKEFTITGEAALHSYVIPNEGDMFVADIGDGREAVFQVTQSSRLSIYRDSAYQISFAMVFFSKEFPQQRADLESKVVQQLHYMREFSRIGQNPLIASDEYAVLEQLAWRKQQLIDGYFSQFFSHEYATIVMPGQQASTYDIFVTKFLRSLLTTSDHPDLVRMRVPNVSDDNHMRMPNLWTALYSRDKDMMKRVVKKMGVISTRHFERNPMMEGIRFSRMERLVFPLSLNPSIDDTYNNLVKIAGIEQIEAVGSDAGNLQTMDLITSIELLDTHVPMIKPVLADDYYVLSDSFYEQAAGPSILEVLVNDALEYKAVRPDWVLKLATEWPQWGGLEKYYYIPLVIFLIRIVMKDW